MKTCPSCNKKKPETKEFWVVVSATSKRGLKYPNTVGRPVGRCKVCRNAAQIAYQKTIKGKRAIKKAYNKRREDPLYALKCRVEAKQKAHERMAYLVKYKGGKCEACGYDKCNSALDFHHTDESDKEFGISERLTNSIESLKKEADKCILLCSNCHREHHHIENQKLLKEQLLQLESNNSYH